MHGVVFAVKENRDVGGLSLRWRRTARRDDEAILFRLAATIAAALIQPQER